MSMLYIVTLLFNLYAEYIMRNAGREETQPWNQDCWEKYQITLSASWETCKQVKKQQLELDMEQQTGSKSGKEYVKAVYCHPVI